MSRNHRPDFKQLLWSAITLGGSSVLAQAYIDDMVMRGSNVQKSMDSLSPIERFLYNQAVVHTFDTIDSCSQKCPRQCVVQEVADLMMPRYVCPTKGTLTSELTPLSTATRGDRALSDNFFPFSSQYLLILIPLAMLILVVLLIVWCRKCSDSSPD